jgi:predicted RNase H-like HicB family nuclease
MEKTRFIYWQDGNWWLGYLEEYPDYMTQGETLEELKKNLQDLTLQYKQSLLYKNITLKYNTCK